MMQIFYGFHLWPFDSSCGGYRWFLWDGSFGGCGMALSGLCVLCVCVCVCVWVGGWGVLGCAKVESSARAPRLPRFILLVRLSDTLLVISILDSV